MNASFILLQGAMELEDASGDDAPQSARARRRSRESRFSSFSEDHSDSFSLPPSPAFRPSHAGGAANTSAFGAARASFRRDVRDSLVDGRRDSSAGSSAAPSFAGGCSRIESSIGAFAPSAAGFTSGPSTSRASSKRLQARLLEIGRDWPRLAETTRLITRRIIDYRDYAVITP